MSEFRFFSFTDYQYRANDSELFTLPIALSTKSTPADDNEMSDDLNVPYMVFEILVAIFAVIGNLMVIIVFQRERKLRRRTNYYIVSLAIADFLVGSLGVPFAILASVGLPHDLYTCLFTVSLLVVLCTISIFCLVAVSVDRYWAILYPMAYSRNVRTRTAIVIISMCWVAGTIVGFLPLFGWHVKPEDEMNMSCHFVKVMDYNYLVFLYFATIITPALLMLAFYMHIYRVIVKQVRQIVTMNPMNNDNNRRTSNTQVQTTPGRLCHGGTMLRVLGASRKRDVKATQNLSIIVLFFMICWIPLYTINCIKAFWPDCPVPAKLTLFCIILSHLNSAGNPVLYAYHLKDFRLALKNFLLRLIGIEVERPTDPMHRFSLASQHRLHSIDASMRHSLQPRIYIDSPIWLRQQQQTLKTSHSTPKCGVITPCLNNIHHTVAAVASVPTDIGRDIWNIMEASSGAELEDVHYEFPIERSSNSSCATATQQKRRGSSKHQHCDSPYTYNNYNYYISPDDSECDEVFLPSHKQNISNSSDSVDSVKPNGRLITEPQRSEIISGKMREKLRSDEMDYDNRVLSNQSALTDSSYSDYDIQQKQSAGHTPPANGGLLRTVQHCRVPPRIAGEFGNHCKLADDASTEGGVGSCSLSTSSQSGLSNVDVYVIENDTNPLSPRRKRKFKKAQRVAKPQPQTPKHNKVPTGVNNKSRSLSCDSGATATPTKEVSQHAKVADGAANTYTNGATKVDTGQLTQGCGNNNNNNSSNVIDAHSLTTNNAMERLSQPHTIHCHPYEKFSPLRAVSHLIFPPIVKHSSLFQLFQPSISGAEHAMAHNASAITTSTMSTTAPVIFSTCGTTATTMAKAMSHVNTYSAHSPAPCNDLAHTTAVSRISSIDESIVTAVTDLSDPKPTQHSKAQPPPPTIDASID